MPEQTVLRSHTPPKYAALLQERNAHLLLEDRLAHFVQWLRETKGVVPAWPVEAIAKGDKPDILDDSVMLKLIQDYVNT